MPSFTWKETTDSHFKRTRLSVEEPVGRVKRRFAVATGCSARLSWHFRAGAGAKVAACGQAGGGRREPARRGAPTTGGRGGLPGDALIELVVRCRLGLGIDFALPWGRQFPKWRATGRRFGGRHDWK